MKKGAAHRKPRRGVLGFLYLSFSSCMQVFGPKRSKTTPPHIGRSIRGKVGRRSWAGTSTTAGMRGLEPSRAWTQALYLASPALPWAHHTNVRQGLMNRYAVHREPQWRMEGFRDTGNSYYTNACRQLAEKALALETSRIGRDDSKLRGTHDSGGRSWTGTSTTAGMRGLEPSHAWTQALRFASPALPWAHHTNIRQGLMNQYAVHREPQWRMEGFRNTGNSCYINACLQGLLSLPEFTTDLQRKCLAQAMLTPKKSGGAPGDISAGLVSATALSAAGGRQSEDGETGGGVEGDATLYAALLQLTMQAGGPHGVMDASEIKRAIDRRSDRFAGNLQQDAHEFLVYLINTLHEETQPRLEAAAAFAASTAPSASASASGDQKKQASDVVGRVEAMAVEREGGNEADSLREDASSERILPTTRHFHAEVEVTLTCPRCAYSRRRRELYRDFSLDVPHLPEGEGEGALGLSELLGGCFKPSVLTLRCYRCDSDQVRVERSFAQLPGALILHMKRFKPLVSSPGAPVAEENEGTAPSCWSGIGTRGGMSYVKLTAPISIPKELDLERFCSSYTANAPADELGETVNNIDELGTPHSRNKTGSAVVYRPWFLKRRADGDRVSIDLPQQESWSEGAGRKRLKGNDGIPVPVEDFEDEVEVALSISRAEALAHDAAQEEQDLARALMLSRESMAEADAARSADMKNSCGVSGREKTVYDDVGEGNGKVELDRREVATSSPGALEDLGECGVCTLHNKRSSSFCKVCDSPKPPSTPWIACSVGVEDSSVAPEVEDLGEEEAVASPLRLLREGPLQARYQLQGVLHHLGQDAHDGHYVTDVREVPRGTGESELLSERQGEGDAIEQVGRWKRHDDTFVSPVSEATALEGPARRSAYICFYSLAR